MFQVRRLRQLLVAYIWDFEPNPSLCKVFFPKKPNMQISINIPPLMTFTLPMLAQHVAIFKHTTARCIRHSKRTFPFSLTRIPRTDIVLGRVDPRQNYLFSHPQYLYSILRGFDPYL
ncbi:hypothetical protein D918_04695 [Trichuris suis]|nr:hypothetical protein D918_04695 [Trichuris suis]